MVPVCSGRIHATNNEFQRYGPKGFMEIKILQNDNLYVRVDLAGVPDDGVRHRVDSVRRKVVFFSGEETLGGDGDKVDKDVREYSGTAGLGCDCCEITGVDAKMKDGVLRMLVFLLSNTRRIHATNNEFQRYGPKGFMEIKILENDNLYVRVDMPGVPDDGVHHKVDSMRQKVVYFSGEETLGGEGDKVDDDVREYSGTAGLGCNCCEITGVDAKMKDGVLRMIVSRVKVKDHDNKCTHFLPPNTGKFGRYNPDESPWNLAELEDHPFVVKGRKDSSTSEGRLFSLDLPGVCGDDMLVLPNENEVKFYGENKEVCEHDESCRIFMGAVKGSSFCAPGVPLLSHDIAWDAEFGVLKVRVSPPGSNISSE
ncbi:hypothetical protein IGI04_007712 [Brassica rapa subsp. trilocularis]|uniref:SHSP domain-containing protein n=1 Tax=Brassica rapa subsp. trilocularis TaxID=1813537 RepID=A0ABQ7NKI4_BRACM|nr:hypothetical protein IGI04_007712 [Brassica rapa subsp. trilocularis]